MSLIVYKLYTNAYVITNTSELFSPKLFPDGLLEISLVLTGF